MHFSLLNCKMLIRDRQMHVIVVSSFMYLGLLVVVEDGVDEFALRILSSVVSLKNRCNCHDIGFSATGSGVSSHDS